MEQSENTIKLYYNTEQVKLQMPEYGRHVLKMVERLKGIEDRAKRTEQAHAVVKVMELLDQQQSRPATLQQEDYQHKLWDQLYVIAGYDLDVDGPFPKPSPDAASVPPAPIDYNQKPVRAREYGRNIERIIDLVATQEDGEVKTELIRCLAIYMRQQYLIWNKDSVADETIFQDLERLSGGRVRVPEGLTLGKISGDAVFARPGMMLGGNNGRNQGGGRRNGKRRKK